MSVLVVGEALIDIIDRFGFPPAEHVGGSPANVALGLGRLDIPVRLLTALGRDQRGARIASHLESSGVEIDPASWTLPRTSTATAHIEQDGGATYHFDIEWQLEDTIQLNAGQSVHVGSIGCFMQPGAGRLIAWLEALPPTTRISFDPNIRTALIDGRRESVATTERISQLADTVKLSDEDAAWLYPGWTIDHVLDHLLSLGTRLAAITLGGDGAVLASAESRAAIPPCTVRVKDTIGAGDTFMAVLVAALAAGELDTDLESLEQVGERASVAAAITVGRVGANLPTHSELSKVIAQQRIERAWQTGTNTYLC